MLGCNNDRLFPEKYTGKDHICNTKRVQRVLLMPPGASRNTPLIELIQYGRRIGKKVYCALLEYLKVYPIRSHPQLLSCLLAALKVRIFFISLFLCDLTTGYRKVLSRFDRNTVRNSGRRQIFWRDVEFCKLENCEMVDPCIPLD